MRPRENRFDQMTTYWRERFLALDQGALISRFHLDADGKALYVVYYGRRYALDRVDGAVRQADAPDAPVPFSTAMSIYHLFCYSTPGARNTGEFVPFRQVKGASPYAPAFERTVAEELSRPFDGHLDALLRACRALGGAPIPQGDAGFVFHAFDCMPVMMVFWDGDEEFPAQANLLFDANVTGFTHEETLCCVAGDLMRRLREEAGLE